MGEDGELPSWQTSQRHILKILTQDQQTNSKERPESKLQYFAEKTLETGYLKWYSPSQFLDLSL